MSERALPSPRGYAARRLVSTSLVSLLTVLLVALVVPSLAGATLVPQKSMKGVKLEHTRQQVIDRLGNPDKTVKKRHEIIGRYFELRYGRTAFSVYPDVEGESGKVFAMVTKSKSERTEDNVGVGSAESKVLDRVKGSRCETEFGRRTCSVGQFRPGRVVTVFFLTKERRVFRISIGRVID